MKALSLFERSSLVLIECLSPLHIGVGRGGGIVDLPVDRDNFGFPFVPSSGLKGALRERFGEEDEEKEKIFGTEKRMGGFSPQDGLLVAIPARSLRGVWGLVTSPFLLDRLKTMSKLGGVDLEANSLLEKAKQLTPEKVLVSKKECFEVDGKIILNEEFELTPQVEETIEKFGSRLTEEGWRLMIVHDDLIREIVNGSLLRRARVALKKETKTVEQGPWEEEDVPPRTIFATLFLYSNDDVRTSLEEKIFDKMYSYLVLGGHETIGRGIVKLKKV
ncbi:MAG: type III-B CRISPR module RAMP protein Cmr4 [Candidatus Hadarchaeales archaeon]